MLRAGAIVLERYVIDAPIGEGGMGSVFRARHVHLDSLVAVKVLRDFNDADKAATLSRFTREGKLLAKLRHPNVVRVVDFGTLPEAGGAPCIVMELLEGPSFEDLLMDHGALPFEQVLALAMAGASALDSIHQHGILHRDVKPANFVQAPDGIRLVDFGIALAQKEDARLTRAGSLVGTPAYAAPEYLLDAISSPATDMYSLGVALYELLTGQLPYSPDNLALLVREALKGPPPLKVPSYRTAPPGVFAQLVMRMLSPKPELRPTAAHVVASANAIQKEASKRAGRGSSSALDDFAKLASSGSSEMWPAVAPPGSVRPTPNNPSSVPPQSDVAPTSRDRGTWSRPFPKPGAKKKSSG